LKVDGTRQRGHVVRRAFGAAVVLVMLAGLIVVVEANPAAAALTNVFPANADGEIYPDDLTVKDSLFVYVTSDLSGGRVCVIAATGDGSCDRPAWGSPNVIIGIGTVFQLIEGPDLVEGDFRLRTESARPAGVPGWEEQATSGVFHIGPCGEGCDPTIGAQQAADFKSAHRAATGLAARACDVLGVTDSEAAGQTIAGGLKAIGSRSVPVMLGFIGGFAVGAIGLELQSYNDAAKKILMMLSCEVGQMAKDIADDPPDPNFATVQQPVFTTLPTTGQATADALAVALDRQAAYGIATRIAYERYQGAVEADNAIGQLRQLDAVSEVGLQLANAHRASAQALRAAAASIEPAVEGVPIKSTAALASVKSIADRVTMIGFTPDEVAQLRALGASDEQIVHARTWFNRSFDLTPGATIDSVLTEVADSFDAAVGPTDAFARAAGAVAIDVPNQAPTASFTASPESGPAPLDVTFTSTSTDPDGTIGTYRWAYGDGVVATGNADVVEHTYAEPGTYTVTLTVTDDVGATNATTRTVVVGGAPSNRAPVATPQVVSTAMNTPVQITLAGADADGDALTYAIAGNPSGSMSGSGAVRTYTPPLNQVGTDVFSFTVNDGAATSAPATVTVNITAPTNRAPVATPQVVSTPINTPIQITLAGTDADGDALTYSASAPSVGSLSGSGAVRTYTPPANQVGTAQFSFTVNDGTVSSAPATVTVNITAPTSSNRAPVATPQVVSTAMNTPVQITLAGADADGDALTYAIAGNPSGSMSGSGAVRTYTPPLNQVGTDVFSFTVNDGAATSAPATVTVNITAPTNRAPVATPQVVSTPINTPIQITLAGTDADGDALTYSASAPSVGSLSGSGAVRTYTPPANQVGTAQFSFTVNDGTVSSAPATVTVNITNLPPTGPDGLGSRLFATGGPVEVEILPANAGQTSTLGLYEPPPQRDIATNREVGRVVQLGSFQPGAELVFGIRSGSGSIFKMGPADRNPDALMHAVVELVSPGVYRVGFEDLYGGGDRDYDDNLFEFRGGIDSTPRAIVLNPVDATRDVGEVHRVTATVRESDGAPAANVPVDFEVVGGPNTGIAGSGVTDGEGRATFDFASDIAGTDEISASFFDTESQQTRRANASVTWAGTLVAADDAATTDEDAPVLVDVLANDVDPDGDPLTVVIDEAPAHGAATVTEAGVRYVPDPDFHGLDTLSYEVTNGSSTATATLTITVLPINDRPTIESIDDIEMAEDALRTITVRSADVDGDLLEITATGLPAFADIVDNGDRAATITFRPGPDDEGSYGPFLVTVSDPAGAAATTEFAALVVDINRSPVAIDDVATTNEDVTANIDVLANDSDPDDDDLAVTSLSPTAAHGTVSCTATGSCTYQPESNFSGPDSFDYLISDGHGGTATASVTVRMTPVNDPPVLTITGSPAAVQHSDPAGPIEISATDVDGDPLVLAAPGLPNGLALTDRGDGTGSISGTATVGAGTYLAEVSVSDGLASDNAPVRVDVSAESAEVSYQGDTLAALTAGQSSRSVRLAAHMTQQADESSGDLTRARVFFDLYRSSNTAMTTPDLTAGPFAPDSAGDVSTTTTLAGDTWTVVVRFEPGNRYFAGNPDVSALTVYTPAAGKVTGGGWVSDPGTTATVSSPPGSSANFGFIVQSKSGKTGIQGQAQFVVRGSNGRSYVIRASSWSGGSLSLTPDGRRASFNGKATVIVFGPKGKEQTLTGATFVVDLTDNGSPGATDSLAVSVNRNGAIFHQLGSAAAQLPLRGGQLTIHKK
jgi:PKD repeat protein